MRSLIYRSPFIYELLMLMLYGVSYVKRRSSIRALIPDHSKVLELCCGPKTLAHATLRARGIEVTGYDLSPEFVQSAKRRGHQIELFDLRHEALPEQQYDCILMQASLYQFMPNHRELLTRMLKATKDLVIIAEPIRNLSDSSIPLLATLGKKGTNPGTGETPQRFTESTFDEAFLPFTPFVLRTGYIPGGREKYVVLSKRAAEQA